MVSGEMFINDTYRSDPGLGETNNIKFKIEAVKKEGKIGTIAFYALNINVKYF